MGASHISGTTSVEKSEVLSKLLLEKKIPHNLLNAKPENVERESEIVAQAGRKGALTIATNMAGRWDRHYTGGQCRIHGAPQGAGVLFPQIVRPEDDNPMAMAQVMSPQPRGPRVLGGMLPPRGRSAKPGGLLQIFSPPSYRPKQQTC